MRGSNGNNPNEYDADIRRSNSFTKKGGGYGEQYQNQFSDKKQQPSGFQRSGQQSQAMNLSLIKEERSRPRILSNQNVMGPATKIYGQNLNAYNQQQAQYPTSMKNGTSLIPLTKNQLVQRRATNQKGGFSNQTSPNPLVRQPAAFKRPPQIQQPQSTYGQV